MFAVFGASFFAVFAPLCGPSQVYEEALIGARQCGSKKYVSVPTTWPPDGGAARGAAGGDCGIDGKITLLLEIVAVEVQGMEVPCPHLA